MAGLADYLPPPFTDAEILALLSSILFPVPTTIRPLKVTAAFHIIYILTYASPLIAPKLPAHLRPTTPTLDLILRISGNHVAAIKTENEAATLSWLRQHTGIPVPDVLAYDVTLNNPLEREFMLLNRCPGVAVSDIYSTLSDTQLDSLINQLIDIQSELHTHEFYAIGGLAHSSSSPSTIIPGLILDEHFWLTPDITTYFPTQTFHSMNALGPFPNYVSYTTASTQKHIHAIRLNSSLAKHKDLLPRLSAFLLILPSHAEILNDVPIRLAHKDLHFANILVDPTTMRITAILDWEFAGTVPFPRWDPARAFLWNGQPGDEAFKEKYRLRARFEEICREREENGEVVTWVKDRAFTSGLQESMHNVMNYLRCIVTMVPRDQSLDLVDRWRELLEKDLEFFGV